PRRRRLAAQPPQVLRRSRVGGPVSTPSHSDPRPGGPADPGPASDPANPGPGTGTTGSGTASAMGSNGSADIDEPPKGGSFGGYFLRKLGGAATSMVLVIVLGFFAFRMLPGDPVLKIAKERPMSPAQIAELRSQYGLDKPVIVQFWDYLVGIVTGDLGESYVYRKTVSSHRRIPRADPAAHRHRGRHRDRHGTVARPALRLEAELAVRQARLLDLADLLVRADLLARPHPAHGLRRHPAMAAHRRHDHPRPRSLVGRRDHRRHQAPDPARHLPRRRRLRSVPHDHACLPDRGDERGLPHHRPCQGPDRGRSPPPAR